MSLDLLSYFGKIPMNIASLLFENSDRIIVILNLNNSASKYTLYLYTNKVKNTEQVKVQNIL
jgi:hypothetical protein